MAERVVIVGAGIIGAAIAYQLSGSGREVIVLDKAMPGQAASGRSFGWINASFHLDEDHFHLRTASMAAWRDLEGALQIDLVSWTGCLFWEMQGKAQADQFETLQALGYPVERFDASALAAKAGVLHDLPDEALWFPTEGFAEADAVTVALLSAAAARGARVVSGVNVRNLLESGARISGVSTELQDIPADRVILAAGVGTSALLADIGIELPMLSRPGLLAHTEPVPYRLGPIIVSEDGQEFRQDAKGRIVVPGSVSHQSDRTSAISGDATEIAEAAIDRVARYLPGDRPKLQRVVYSPRPVPGDGHPAIGPIGPQGLYMAVLHSGVTLAPLVGKLVAEDLGAGNSPEQLARYRPSRFFA